MPLPKTFVFASFLALLAGSCINFEKRDSAPVSEPALETDSSGFSAALGAHLLAVQQHDFEALKKTVPASGPFYLALPDGTLFTTAEEFLRLHQEWFQDTSWTMATKVLFADAGSSHGTALIEAINREPERNGKPYFHKMFITYGLKKVDGNWLVVHDHASTIEKSE